MATKKTTKTPTAPQTTAAATPPVPGAQNRMLGNNASVTVRVGRQAVAGPDRTYHPGESFACSAADAANYGGLVTRE